MKRVSKPTSYLSGGKQMSLIKKLTGLLWALAIALAFSQGCTSSTGSSSSSGSGSTIGRIQVLPATPSLQASQTQSILINGNSGIVPIWSSTSITIIVHDNNGNIPPSGTPVNILCGAGYLGDNPDINNPISSITLTTNGNGQVQVKYTAGFTTGTASISATALGNSGSATISIV